MPETWRKMAQLHRDRSDEMRRRMEAYDEEVYYPAIKALQAECAAIGHGPTTEERNGLGWNWRRCRHCEARTEEWSDEKPPSSDGR